MFTQTLSKKKFYFVVVILSLFVLMLTEENAEARRRGFFRRRVFSVRNFGPCRVEEQLDVASAPTNLLESHIRITDLTALMILTN
ncbi:hypothetical protein EBQ74_05875 [bacterium]|nr:hypothetical protein [bacterium]